MSIWKIIFEKNQIATYCIRERERESKDVEKKTHEELKESI